MPLTRRDAYPCEKNEAQTREFYEQSKDALEAALETLERSFDAVGKGATALNRKVMHIAQNSFAAPVIRFRRSVDIVSSVQVHTGSCVTRCMRAGFCT